MNENRDPRLQRRMKRKEGRRQKGDSGRGKENDRSRMGSLEEVKWSKHEFRFPERSVVGSRIREKKGVQLEKG